MQGRILAALLLLMPAGMQAGFVKYWQLKETAQAPAIVLGRVLDTASRPGKGNRLSMTADIQVLRSYTGKPAPGERIRVHFFKYDGTVHRFVNGYPPPLPDIRKGHVIILALQVNTDPESEPWQLTAESGVDLTIPARAEMPESEAPATPRAFLIREIANALSRGTPSEVFGTSRYLASQHEDLTSELMPLLKTAIEEDRQRWAEVAANLLAALGIPRPGIADLLSKQLDMKKWLGRESLPLAQAALEQLKASADTDALLIQTWIAEAPLDAWGSANSLLEFGDDPITTQALAQALRDDVAGTSEIAFMLARNGHRETLPEALARALKVADRPRADFNDLQGAVALLRDYGSDGQQKRLTALVEKYHTRDKDFYSLLWQLAAGYPRGARVFAIVLKDRRVASGEWRYCDYAASALQSATGQHFISSGETLAQRDAAVAKAQAWLKSQAIVN